MATVLDKRIADLIPAPQRISAKQRKERGTEQAIVREMLACSREEELTAAKRYLAWRRRFYS